MAASGPSLVAIDVGNTRTKVAQIVDGEVRQTRLFENRRLAGTVQQVVEWWRTVAGRPQAAVLVASVNDRVAERLTATIQDQLSLETYRVGEDVPVPIGHQLDPETITGVDRLLNAAAAYDRIRQASVVVDAGSAVTVDFVDGEGTFHGGAILPGAAMQLRALHEHTALLPELAFAAPDEEAFGRNTAQAMLNGVFHGLRGAVQRLVERYAERYGAFPQVIATGGDAPVLFANDELIDNIVPDLTIQGIAVAARHALAGNLDDRDTGA